MNLKEDEKRTKRFGVNKTPNPYVLRPGGRCATIKRPDRYQQRVDERRCGRCTVAFERPDPRVPRHSYGPRQQRVDERRDAARARDRARDAPRVRAMVAVRRAAAALGRRRGRRRGECCERGAHAREKGSVALVDGWGVTRHCCYGA